MNRSDTHRKPILLDCDQIMQTEPEDDSKPDSDSEAKDFDFPLTPIRIGNHPPLLFPRYSPHPRAATGLGQMNIVNTIDVDSDATLHPDDIKGSRPLHGKRSNRDSFDGSESELVQLAIEHRSKRRHLTRSRDNSDGNMRSVIANIKETVEGVKEDIEGMKEGIEGMKEDVDHIKEILEEISYEVKEERDNLHSMLADILAEVQQMD